MEKTKEALPKTRLCPHCKGRRVCNCDQCIQSGGTCGYCQGYGHLVIPAIGLDLEKPAVKPGVSRAIIRAARRRK